MNDKPTDRQRQARALRSSGLTWEAVGNAMGVSRQGAQQAAYPAAQRRRTERRDLRARHPAYKLEPVTSARLREGCSGHIRGTRSRWWELTLACGCVVERKARYVPRVDAMGRLWSERSLSDVLRAPKRAACERHHNPTV